VFIAFIFKSNPVVEFDDWARENPKIWDNKNGISVYSYNKAWGKSEDETLTHNDIIIHLKPQVLQQIF
jgi:hypothetical protein